MIQVWRNCFIVAVSTETVGALRIKNDEDDVGLCHSRLTQARNYIAYRTEKHPSLTVYNLTVMLLHSRQAHVKKDSEKPYGTQADCERQDTYVKMAGLVSLEIAKSLLGLLCVSPIYH